MVRIGLGKADNIVHTVIRCLTAKTLKTVKRNAIRLFQGGQIHDLHAASLAKRLEVSGNAAPLNVQTLVGAERGKDFRLKTALGNLLMILQRIGRIIRSTKKIHIGIANKVLGAHIGRSQLFRSDLPDLLTVLLTDHKITVKVTLKLQMAPMVQRITDELGHYRAICFELIKIGAVARDVLFVYAAGAHCSPLIVVAVKPHFSDVGVTLILGDLPRGQVAVIIDDRQFFRIVVEKDLRGLGRKKKIFIHKLLHKGTSQILKNIK